MPILVYIIGFSLLISFFSLVGVFSLAFSKKSIEKIVLFLVSLSAGTLIGGAFIHLLPEAAEELSIDVLFLLVLFSFVIFFLIEKILHWRHCHEENCEVHTFGYINIIGDGVHNFIDGLIIAATFLIDIKLGITASAAIILHEIPQGMGNFGVLIYAGFKRSRALFINFLVALTIVVGGIVGYLLSFYIDNLTVYLLPLAAGGFIYISTSDLIPEIRKERDVKKSFLSFFFFLVGIAIMFLVKLI